MPRRRERPEPQGDILSPFDLAKKLRGAVQAKDLKTLERLFQRSEVGEMDDRRCAGAKITCTMNQKLHSK
jgi:hypothetical protein